MKTEMLLNINAKRAIIGSVLLIFGIAIIPLFFNLPFRDNIYLSWEGAYRMYHGQMPFKDFGLPMGYSYWLLPALAFHLFGPYLISLVKIQVLINIVSGITFLSIIRRFTKDSGLILVTVFLYVISFSFYNFWPWYNHTVIVYEFIGLTLLLGVLIHDGAFDNKQKLLTVLSAFFSFLSFFTKQDGGAFALLISGVLITYSLVIIRDWKPIVFFGLGYALTAAIFIVPLLQYDFGYWFNYGQEPHYSRISLYDFLSSILGESSFIKLYFLAIVIILVAKSKSGLSWLKEKKFMLHLLLTLGILFQASILQVTSYVPADGNIYYHSFMFFFILTQIGSAIDFSKVKNFVILVALVLFWWSGLYWKYTNRMFAGFFESDAKSEKNIVSVSSYTMTQDTMLLDKSSWGYSQYEPFKKIKLPVESIDAIERINEWYQSQKEKPVMLNMSEMTPLAEVLGYELESGSPLWYHLNVGMFDRELKKFESRIDQEYYDIVLFEEIPHLNNFYPFAIDEKLSEKYDLWFAFQAPREMKTEVVKVYLKKR